MSSATEQLVEYVASVYFGSIGVAIKRGGALQCVLISRLGASVQRPKPDLLQGELEGVVRTLSRPPHPTLVQNKRWLHGQPTIGVEIEYLDAKGPENCGGAPVRDAIALLSRTS